MVAFIFILTLLTGNKPEAVTSQCLKDEIVKYVMDRCQDSPDSIVVEFRNLPDSILLSAPPQSVTVVESRLEDLKGNVSIPVRFVCGNTYEQTVLVSARIRRFAFTIVASKKIDRHRPMYLDEVRFEKKEITTLPDDIIRSTQLLEGKRTRRMIAEGTTLCESMFEEIPAIDSGDEVIMMLRAGNVTLSTKATARVSGCPGDIITVEQKGKRDRFKARVISSKIVMVDPE